LKILPGLNEQEAMRILNKDIFKEELKHLLPVIKECLEIDKELENDKGWREFRGPMPGIGHLRKEQVKRPGMETKVSKIRYGMT
jgi:hypothetical protein